MQRPRYLPKSYVKKHIPPEAPTNIFNMRNGIWYRWFAWYPVKLSNGQWALFEYIARMKVRDGFMYYDNILSTEL